MQQRAMGLATRQYNPSGKQRGMKTCKAKARPPCAASEPCAAVQQAMFFPCLQKAPPCPGHFGPLRRRPWAWLADRWVDTSQRPQQARHRRQFYGKNRLQCRLGLRCKLFFNSKKTRLLPLACGTGMASSRSAAALLMQHRIQRVQGNAVAFCLLPFAFCLLPFALCLRTSECFGCRHWQRNSMRKWLVVGGGWLHWHQQGRQLGWQLRHFKRRSSHSPTTTASRSQSESANEKWRPACAGRHSEQQKKQQPPRCARPSALRHRCFHDRNDKGNSGSLASLAAARCVQARQAQSQQCQ